MVEEERPKVSFDLLKAEVEKAIETLERIATDEHYPRHERMRASQELVRFKNLQKKHNLL